MLILPRILYGSLCVFLILSIVTPAFSAERNIGSVLNLKNLKQNNKSGIKKKPVGKTTQARGSRGNTGSGKEDSLDGIVDVELPGVMTVENKYVIVVFKDRLSGKMVLRICDEVVSMMKKYFDVPDRYHNRIIVELIPSEMVSFKSPYRIYLTKAGNITVSISWNKDTSFRVLCQAIVRGFVMMWTRENLGHGRANAIPSWIDLAFSIKLEVFMNPGNRELFKYKARDIPTLTISQVIRKDAVRHQNLETLSLHSFWLFEFLRRKSVSRSVYGRFLTRVLAGRDVLTLIKKEYIKEDLDEKERHLWWAVGLHNLISSGNAWLYTMRESKIIIRQFGSVTVEMHGSDTKLTLKQVWKQRKHPSVVAALRWALRDIKLELCSINPVYHNTLHSIGLVYESFLEDNLELSNERMTTLSKDYYAAVNLEKGIRELFVKGSR